jgi:hypothetical protein
MDKCAVSERCAWREGDIVSHFCHHNMHAFCDKLADECNCTCHES